MKYAMKEALVLTIPDGGDGPGRWRASSRFVFYIDTDAEKIAFIDWYVKNVDTMFKHLDTPFRAFIAQFPDGTSALYFESTDSESESESSDYGEVDERVFPLGSDANKLALFELIIACELDEILGLHFRKVKVRVPMDTEEATKALTAKLPVELAETIVASAVSEE